DARQIVDTISTSTNNPADLVKSDGAGVQFLERTTRSEATGYHCEWQRGLTSCRWSAPTAVTCPQQVQTHSRRPRRFAATLPVSWLPVKCRRHTGGWIPPALQS